MLSPDEVETLIGLLRRLHVNLPAVEAASDEFMRSEAPARPARRRAPKGKSP